MALRYTIDKADDIFQRETKRVLSEVLLEICLKHHLEYSSLVDEFVAKRSYGISQDVGRTCQGLTQHKKKCGKPGVYGGYCEIHLSQRDQGDAKRRREEACTAKRARIKLPAERVTEHVRIMSVSDCLSALGLER